MREYIVETKNLKKYYQMGANTVKALDGVDFRVKDQEFVAIIGKSGSGKSTLLHMLGGLDVPTEGEVLVEGKCLLGLKKEQLAIFRRRKIGFIFQNYNLVPDLNVYENVILPVELDGRKVDRKAKRWQTLFFPPSHCRASLVQNKGTNINDQAVAFHEFHEGAGWHHGTIGFFPAEQNLNT